MTIASTSTTHRRCVEFLVEKCSDGRTADQTISVLMVKINQCALVILGIFELPNQREVDTAEGILTRELPTGLTVRFFQVGTDKQTLITLFPTQTPASSFPQADKMIAFTMDPTSAKSTNSKDEALSLFRNRDCQPNIRGFLLKRVASCWRDFNDVKGVRFKVNSFDVRMHTPELSLIDQQKKDFEKISEQSVALKSKQLQLHQKLHEAKEKKNQKHVESLNAELIKLSKEIEDVSAHHKRTLNADPIHASVQNVLRVHPTICYPKRNDVMQLLFTLQQHVHEHTREHFHEKCSIFVGNETDSTKIALKKEILRLYKELLEFCRKEDKAITAENERLRAEAHTKSQQLQSQPRSKNTEIKKMEKEEIKRLDSVTDDWGENNRLETFEKHLRELDELITTEEELLKTKSAHANLNPRLSNDWNTMLMRIQDEQKKSESSLHERTTFFLQHATRRDLNFCQNYVQYLAKRNRLVDAVLIRLGVIVSDKTGKERYITNSEYAEKRVMIDQKLQKLYACIFLLAARDNFTPENHPIDALKTHPIISLLKLVPPFLQFDESSFSTPFDQLINANPPTKALFDPCQHALNTLLQEIRKQQRSHTNWEDFLESVDSKFSQLLKTDSSDAIKEMKKAFKKDTSPSTLLRQTEIAHQLLQKSPSIAAKPFLEELKSQGLSLLEELLSTFPEIRCRKWLQQHGQHFSIATHVFWPTENSGDPFYKENTTHVPLKLD